MSRGYGWPLRPFNQQHAIRGAFGDPRFGAQQRNFHFGIDIPARGGTPVYAVFLAPSSWHLTESAFWLTVGQAMRPAFRTGISSRRSLSIGS